MCYDKIVGEWKPIRGTDMNNKQKQKRAVLAVALAVLLAIIIAISAAISCGTSKCAGSASPNVQGNSDVIVSEILVSNKQTVLDPLGTYSDYIELYNRSNSDIDLFGYGLTDDEISIWMFPSESIIRAHEYLVVWCMKNDPKKMHCKPLFQVSSALFIINCL